MMPSFRWAQPFPRTGRVPHAQSKDYGKDRAVQGELAAPRGDIRDRGEPPSIRVASQWRTAARPG